MQNLLKAKASEAEMNTDEVSVEMSSTSKPFDEERETESSTPHRTERMVEYEIEDVPPWYLCIVLGFQVRFDTTLHTSSHQQAHKY